MARRIAVVLTLSGLLLGVFGTAGAVTPSNGQYAGSVNGAVSHEGDGSFLVKGTAATKKIVPYNGYITAPSNFACNQINARVEATKIKVKAGAFDYSGKANIGTNQARVKIHIAGTWKTGTRVKGYTRIWTGSCDSGKVHWTMDKV
jgi:isoaspartyl peptidase/L-asparaginase-like protein (Ntn-hydrolase superfamily)